MANDVVLDAARFTGCRAAPTIAAFHRRTDAQMQLLVSVGTAAEAAAAMRGGADIVDAKDPRSGALGAVAVPTLGEIRLAVAGQCPLTAALGDAADRGALAHDAEVYAAGGAGLVKVAFPDIRDETVLADLIGTAVDASARGRRGGGVVAVAYAEASEDDDIDALTLIEVAAHAGARGVLVDTRDKQGRGLTSLWTAERLASWIDEAHRQGLFAAVAGRLAAGDLVAVRDAGADIAGVRGAACDGGRAGIVSAERVRRLRELID